MDKKTTLYLQDDVKQKLKEIAKKEVADEYEKPSMSKTISKMVRERYDKLGLSTTKKNIEVKKQSRKIASKPQYILPDYIDRELFLEFIEIRKKLKAVNSDRAIKTLLNKIESFYQLGYNANDIINNSIVNSWKNVYEPKNFNNGQKLSTVAKNNQAAIRYIDEHDLF